MVFLWFGLPHDRAPPWTPPQGDPESAAGDAQSVAAPLVTPQADGFFPGGWRAVNHHEKCGMFTEQIWNFNEFNHYEKWDFH